MTDMQSNVIGQILAGASKTQLDGMANNPNTPEGVLDRLSDSERDMVRIGVARNPTTRVETLRKLASDQDEAVRAHVAENPNTPVDALVALAQQPGHLVHDYLLQNPNLPPELVPSLQKSVARMEEDFDVASDPDTEPARLLSIARTGSKVERELVANHSSCPEEALRLLADDADEVVRYLVAGNPHAPEDVLRRLSQDPLDLVRRGVAQNHMAPPDLLTSLAQDRKAEVRGGVAGNYSRPEHVLESLKNDRSKHVSEAANRTPRRPRGFDDYHEDGVEQDEFLFDPDTVVSYVEPAPTIKQGITPGAAHGDVPRLSLIQTIPLAIPEDDECVIGFSYRDAEGPFQPCLVDGIGLDVESDQEKWDEAIEAIADVRADFLDDFPEVANKTPASIFVYWATRRGAEGFMVSGGGGYCCTFELKLPSSWSFVDKDPESDQARQVLQAFRG